MIAWIAFLAVNSLFIQKGDAFHFLENILVDPNHNPHIGSSLIFRCISNREYEHCSWRHQRNICSFDWKIHHDTMKKPRCDAYGDRLTFLGTYETHECKIELNKVETSDSGRWACDMTNKRGEKVSQYIDISVIPPPTQAQNLSKRSKDVHSNDPRPTLEKSKPVKSSNITVEQLAQIVDLTNQTTPVKNIKQEVVTDGQPENKGNFKFQNA